MVFRSIFPIENEALFGGFICDMQSIWRKRLNCVTDDERGGQLLQRQISFVRCLWV